MTAARMEQTHHGDVAHEGELVFERPAAVRTVHLGQPHGAAVPEAEAIDE